jgi:hypothetical protein
MTVAVPTVLGSAASAATPVITIAQMTTGTSLSQNSLGLSYEASDLALPSFTSGNLASYLRTLGTSADLTALNTLAKASGWKVILGVNMKQYDPNRAADEAAHAAVALGSSLQAIEIGNESDLYSQYRTNTAQFFADFQAYVSAITKSVPGVPIEGDDAATSPTGTFQNAFISAQQGLSHPDIVELTNHYYPLSDCGNPNPGPTIAQLLGTTVRNGETGFADSLVAQAPTPPSWASRR